MIFSFAIRICRQHGSKLEFCDDNDHVVLPSNLLVTELLGQNIEIKFLQLAALLAVERRGASSIGSFKASRSTSCSGVTGKKIFLRPKADCS